MSQIPPCVTGQAESFVRKKILLMGHSDGQGGAQTAFRSLCAFTANEEHVVKIIVLSNFGIGKQPFKREAILGIIAYTGSKLFLRARKVIDVLNVGIKAWRFQPDIFVCVGLNNSSNSIARFVGSRCFKVGQDFIARRTIEDPVWASSRKVMNGLVVQAPSMLSYWENLGTNTSKVNWLPCFPDVPADGVLKQQRNVLSTSIKLAYFGRLAGNKGLDLLLSALGDLNTPKDIHLDLWGCGQEEAALKQLATDLDLLRMVRFLGPYPSGAEGAALIASYDAIVLCSTGMEGLPLILLESMAYGVPFLATNVGAIADCCTNNPDTILVSPTIESISRGLTQMFEQIENGHFNAPRQKAFYDHTFSHQVMGARWRKFFEDPDQFFYAK